jgi:hypothetical protein
MILSLIGLATVCWLISEVLVRLLKWLVNAILDEE